MSLLRKFRLITLLRNIYVIEDNFQSIIIHRFVTTYTKCQLYNMFIAEVYCVRNKAKFMSNIRVTSSKPVAGDALWVFQNGCFTMVPYLNAL